MVTSLVFKTVPAPTATSFHLVWPHVHAAAVIGVWQAWAPAARDELAASVLVTAAGDVDLPPLVNLFGVMLGPESDTVELLYGLIAQVGLDPTSAFYRHASYRETKRYLADLGDAMAGDDRLGETSQSELSPQGHTLSKSEFFQQPLPADAVTALVENLQEKRIAGQSRELAFTPWGSAYNRMSADATAFVHRDSLFLLQHEVVVDPDVSTAKREAAQRWLTRSWELVHPWGSGGVYPNFPDSDLENWAHAYHGTNLDHLVHLKARYDPDGFFHFLQSLPY